MGRGSGYRDLQVAKKEALKDRHGEVHPRAGDSQHRPASHGFDKDSILIYHTEFVRKLGRGRIENKERKACLSG